ncbi:MAG: sigma-54 dependent transcriptional regulator [Bacteroidales bacterium]|nr:sigma-54 dependent transcriptional regulator [Bacteroidales bacterium]
MEKNNGQILVIDDDKDILLTTKIILKKHFKRIKLENDPSSIMKYLDDDIFDVILLDMNFAAGATSGKEGLLWLKKILSKNSDAIVVMMTAYGDIDLAVKAMKEGAIDFIVKPWDNKKLVATVVSAFKFSQSKKMIEHLKVKQRTLSKDIDQPFTEMIGVSDAMKNVFLTIEKVAKTDANILILGENGTGKELVARALHRKSNRANQIFINIDLGAISESLFESELFGHVKGAFTDAKESRAGRFEIASGGTLFLDEIGNLTLPLQSKLLSVIQNREVIRIGSNKNIPIDIRLICATNIPATELKNEINFRQDLLYRINTVEIEIPPLRERIKDIPYLSEHFLKIFAKKYHKENKKISKDAIKKLSKYHWTGNIRELQHVVERAVIMSETPVLKPTDFLLRDIDIKGMTNSNLNLEKIELKAIKKALLKNKGNLSKTAKELGLGRTTLYRKMNKYGL